MDSSGSVQQQNWIRIKDFAKDVISGLMTPDLDYRFAFVTFGSSASTDISLDEYVSYQQFSDVLGLIQWRGESSNIADGLRKARQCLLLGSRTKIPSLVVLVTDGPASADENDTEMEAAAIRQMNDTLLMMVGVTAGVDTDQLLRMASYPKDDFVQLFDRFEYLQDVSHVVGIAKQAGKPIHSSEYRIYKVFWWGEDT